MLGWKELAAKVDSAYANVDSGNNTLVLCDNYGQAGAINYYSKENIQAVSMNADYIDWINLEKNYRNVILVQEITDDDPERNVERPYFEDVKWMGRIENKLAREYGSAIYVLKGAKVSVTELLKEEMAERRNN